MSGKQRVLVVDDEPRNQRIVAETLEDWVEYGNAPSGEEAMKMIESFAPDLVLLDIMMPGIDGYEVCKQIRANPKLELTKIILVSGKAMVEERLKGYESGADDYMTKPFVPEELLAKAKVFLRLARTERQIAALNHYLEEKVQEKRNQLLAAEAKLVNSAKMAALGEMAGGIAHEINTPLSTIGMISEHISDLLDEEQIDRRTSKEMARTIGETVQRIARIVRGLKTFSRDGEQDRMAPAPIKRILDDTLALCGEKIKHGDIELQVGEIADGLQVRCRAVQISQVLLNLIGNACDAVAPLPEKWIKVTVEMEGDRVRILITDSGKGIAEKTRKKIFQPFFTTKEIGKGTGLGLSVSKGIAETHGGTLDVDASCPNTRFVLCLPVGKEISSSQPAPTRKAA